MKKVYFTVLLLFALTKYFSQAPFWTETFGTGCNSGTYASGLNASGNGSWTVVSSGPNDADPNEWYVSADEAGMGIGNCGGNCSGANGSNRTLHVGQPMGGDGGATYMSMPGFTSTDSRAQSPLVNCTGQANISLSFEYILGGVPGVDYIQVQYSANGGSTWSTIATPAQTNNTICPNAGQGVWAGYTVTLPASANNNSNVMIGFRWINTDPTGADPSFAVDNIKLSPLGFSPSFTMITSACIGNSVNVVANTGTNVVTGYTWTAAPAGPVIAAPNTSATSITYTSAGTFSITLSAISGGTTASQTNTITINSNPTVNVTAAPANTLCSGSTVTLTANGAGTYTWNPGNMTGSNVAVSPTVSTNYSVSATGTNNCPGSSSFSLTVQVCTGIEGFELNNASYQIYPNPAGEKLLLKASSAVNEGVVEIYDLVGKMISETRLGAAAAGNVYSLNVSSLEPGTYLLKITSGEARIVKRFVKE